MAHFRIPTSASVVLKLLSDVVATVALIWFAAGSQHTARIFISLIVILALIIAWLIVTGPICWFTPHQDSLKPDADVLRFVVNSTGYIKELTYKVQRWGIEPYKSGWLVSPDQTILHINTGHGRLAENKPIPFNQFGGDTVDLLIACTAGEDGWEERLTLTRQQDGSLRQSPVQLFPNFPKGRVIYPERPFDKRKVFLLIPIAVGLCFLGRWAWPSAPPKTLSLPIPHISVVAQPQYLTNPQSTGATLWANVRATNTGGDGEVMYCTSFLFSLEPKLPDPDAVNGAAWILMSLDEAAMYGRRFSGQMSPGPKITTICGGWLPFDHNGVPLVLSTGKTTLNRQEHSVYASGSGRAVYIFDIFAKAENAEKVYITKHMCFTKTGSAISYCTLPPPSQSLLLKK